MDRFFYSKYLRPNLYFDNQVNQRMKNLNYKIDRFDDLLELFQILLYVDKAKKFEQQKNYKSDLTVDKSDLYPLINEYNNNYATEDICKWLEQVAKNKKSYFFRSECGFWSFLYEHKNDITLIIEKYFDLFTPGGIFLNKDILKKYFDKISDLMIQHPKSIEFYYYKFNDIQEFSNKLYDSGKKEKIIANYLKLSDLNPNVLEYIFYDPRISPDELKNARLINVSIDKYKKISNSILEKNKGIEIKSFVNIGDKKLQSKNPLEKIFNFDKRYLESMLNSCDILTILLKNISLIDDNFIFSAIAEKEDSFSAISRIKQYAGNSFPYPYYKNEDKHLQFLFSSYLYFLNEHGIHIFDVFNVFFGKIVSQKYYIYNFQDIKFEKKEVPKDNIREMMEKLDSIFKLFNGFTKYEGISMEDVDQIKHVPRVENIRSLIPKKYVYVIDNNIMRLSYEVKQNMSVLEKLKNNNCSASVLENYEYTLMENLFNKKILFIEDDMVKVKNPELLLILAQLSKYGYIVYHALNKKQQAIVDNWIDEGKAKIYNRFFSKLEADYLNYYLNDTFVNGLKLRNKYTHGSTNTYSDVQHKNNEMIFMYLISMIVLKLIEEFSYFKKYC